MFGLHQRQAANKQTQPIVNAIIAGDLNRTKAKLANAPDTIEMLNQIGEQAINECARANSFPKHFIDCLKMLYISPNTNRVRLKTLSTSTLLAFRKIPKEEQQQLMAALLQAKLLFCNMPNMAENEYYTQIFSQTDIIKQIIDEVDSVTGMTALHHAYKNKNAYLAHYLLQANAAADIKDCTGKIAKDYSSEIDAVITLSLEMANRDHALFTAINHEDEAEVEKYLSLGANLQAMLGCKIKTKPTDELITTELNPLVFAFQKGNEKIALKIIDHIVNPLFAASCLEKLTELIAKNDAYIKLRPCIKALIFSDHDSTCRTLRTTLLKADALESIKLLAGDSLCHQLVTAKNKNGDTILHRAAEMSDHATINWLINNGAEINEVDAHGDTALIIATISGDYKTAQLLLSLKANPNIYNSIGNLGPLQFASQINRLDFVTLLIEHQADVNHVTKNGSVLIEAIANKNNVLANYYLKYTNIDINIQTETGYTALNIAIAKNNKLLATKILEKNPALEIADKRGMTPLKYACFNGEADIVDLLLEKGACPENTADDVTALQLALFQRNQCPRKSAEFYEYNKICEALINAGAKKDVSVEYAETPDQIKTSNVKSIVKSEIEIKEASLRAALNDRNQNDILNIIRDNNFIKVTDELLNKLHASDCHEVINKLYHFALENINKHPRNISMLVSIIKLNAFKLDQNISGINIVKYLAREFTKRELAPVKELIRERMVALLNETINSFGMIADIIKDKQLLKELMSMNLGKAFGSAVQHEEMKNQITTNLNEMSSTISNETANRKPKTETEASPDSGLDLSFLDKNKKPKKKQNQDALLPTPTITLERQTNRNLVTETPAPTLNSVIEQLAVTKNQLIERLPSTTNAIQLNPIPERKKKQKQIETKVAIAHSAPIPTPSIRATNNEPVTNRFSRIYLAGHADGLWVKFPDQIYQIINSLKGFGMREIYLVGSEARKLLKQKLGIQDPTTDKPANDFDFTVRCDDLETLERVGFKRIPNHDNNQLFRMHLNDRSTIDIEVRANNDMVQNYLKRDFTNSIFISYDDYHVYTADERSLNDVLQNIVRLIKPLKDPKIALRLIKALNKNQHVNDEDKEALRQFRLRDSTSLDGFIANTRKMLLNENETGKASLVNLLIEYNLLDNIFHIKTKNVCEATRALLEITNNHHTHLKHSLFKSNPLDAITIYVYRLIELSKSETSMTLRLNKLVDYFKTRHPVFQEMIYLPAVSQPIASEINVMVSHYQTLATFLESKQEMTYEMNSVLNQWIISFINLKALLPKFEAPVIQPKKVLPITDEMSNHETNTKRTAPNRS